MSLIRYDRVADLRLRVGEITLRVKEAREKTGRDNPAAKVGSVPFRLEDLRVCAVPRKMFASRKTVKRKPCNIKLSAQRPEENKRRDKRKAPQRLGAEFEKRFLRMFVRDHSAKRKTSKNLIMVRLSNRKMLKRP